VKHAQPFKHKAAREVLFFLSLYVLLGGIFYALFLGYNKWSDVFLWSLLGSTGALFIVFLLWIRHGVAEREHLENSLLIQQLSRSATDSDSDFIPDPRQSLSPLSLNADRKARSSKV